MIMLNNKELKMKHKLKVGRDRAAWRFEGALNFMGIDTSEDELVKDILEHMLTGDNYKFKEKLLLDNHILTIIKALDSMCEVEGELLVLLLDKYVDQFLPTTEENGLLEIRNRYTFDEFLQMKKSFKEYEGE